VGRATFGSASLLLVLGLASLLLVLGLVPRSFCGGKR